LLIALHGIDEFDSKSIRFEAALVHVDVQGYVDAFAPRRASSFLAKAEAMARRNGIMYETVMVDTGGKRHRALPSLRRCVCCARTWSCWARTARRGSAPIAAGKVTPKTCCAKHGVPDLMVRDPDEVRRVRPSAAKPRGPAQAGAPQNRARHADRVQPVKRTRVETHGGLSCWNGLMGLHWRRCRAGAAPTRVAPGLDAFEGTRRSLMRSWDVVAAMVGAAPRGPNRRRSARRESRLDSLVRYAREHSALYRHALSRDRARSGAGSSASRS
jgi:hypothetical protein